MVVLSALAEDMETNREGNREPHWPGVQSANHLFIGKAWEEEGSLNPGPEECQSGGKGEI